jgi:hypothetical protein
MDTITVNSFQATGTQYCMAILDKMGCPVDFSFNAADLIKDNKQVCILRNPYDAILNALYLDFENDSNSETNDMSNRELFNSLLRNYFDRYEKFMTFPVNEIGVMFYSYDKLMSDPESAARDMSEFFGIQVSETVYSKINKKDLYAVLEHHVEGTGNHLKNIGGHQMSFKANYNLQHKETKIKLIQAELSKTAKLRKKFEDLNVLYAEKTKVVYA